MDIRNILEKKYEILKTSLNFKNSENYEKLLEDYRDVAIKLEKMIEDEYQDGIKDYIYPTEDLDKEKERLEKLIDFTNELSNKQSKFNGEFYEVTGRVMDNVINIEEDIEANKRLEAINNYNSNNKKIESLEEEINKYKELLDENKKLEEGYGDSNKKLELELKEDFDDVINLNNCFEKIDIEDISFELEKLAYSIEESKSNLDNFYLAYQTLENGNLTNEVKKEYQGYVFEARKEYYKLKQTELLLKTFELVNKIELDYTKIYQKREKIELLLEERLILRKQLQIISSDFLKEFYEKAKNQFNVIKKEQVVMDNILNYETKIKSLDEDINSLRKDNERVDILTILNEYKIIDTYEIEEDKIKDSEEVTILPNEVIECRDSNFIDFNNIYNNAIIVMKEVGNQFLDTKKEENKEDEVKIEKVELPKEDIFLENKDKKEDDFFIEMDNNDKDNNNDIFINNNISVSKEAKEDDFFSDTEKKELAHNYETKPSSIDDEIVNNGFEFPDVDSIGSVKPLSNINDIQSQVNELNGINIPTNGFINNINNDLSINGNDYLN